MPRMTHRYGHAPPNNSNDQYMKDVENGHYGTNLDGKNGHKTAR